MQRIARLPGVSGGTAQANAWQPFAIIGSMMPGAGVDTGVAAGFGVAVFYDRGDPTTLFFGDSFASTQELYDPYRICCAFGSEDAEDGIVADVVMARYNQYVGRYEIVAPYGLCRRAVLDGNLTAGGTASADILVDDPDGNPLAGFPNVTVNSWQDSGSDTIPLDTPIHIWYESASRKWYTSAFYRTP